MSGSKSHPPEQPESLGDRASQRGASPLPGSNDSTDVLPRSELSPANIGPYRLLEKIGEGGMGMVFVAEQVRPIHRRVAIKLIKLGMDSKEVIARFESERQALAMMNHPNIAHVYDAGVSESGRPYFVMEHVSGLPITEYCDRNRLTMRARLELFIPICQAIHHAHQNGIIHRDVKPTNILVTVRDGKPVPKVIDFGVAKALHQRLTENTVYTELGKVIGTPAYMSPEQAEMTGLHVDTTTDIYSLGVVLYELLIGVTPFETRVLLESGWEALCRAIRESDPPAPSTRVSTLGARAVEVAVRRQLEPAVLARHVRGELDWITLRALAKDRTRRYASASEFAADIERFLSNEPVLARPPSAAYQFQKLVARHRVTFAFATTVVILLAGFGIWMSVLYARSERNLARAVQAEAEASKVSDFLVNLFSVSDPYESRGETITARELLDEGAKRLELELADQPLVRARLISTIGVVYRNLGLNDRARPLAEEALETLSGIVGEDHPDVATSLVRLGVIEMGLGDFGAAERHLERALAIQEGAFGPNDRRLETTLLDLGIVLSDQGRQEQARALIERALAIRHAHVGAGDSSLATGYNNYASVLTEMGEMDSARAYFERAAAIYEQCEGPRSLNLAGTLMNMASVFTLTGDYARAAELFDRALAIRVKALGPEHYEVAQVLINKATLHLNMGELAIARADGERAFRAMATALGPDHLYTGNCHHVLAAIYADAGEVAKAEAAFVRAQEIFDATFGPDHAYSVMNRDGHAEFLRENGREGEADGLVSKSR
jgi:serine/threonine protein kinase/Tfp pilus assembly protein PilF